MANGVATVSLGTFDTHRFIKRLIAAGLPEASAETFADEQVRLIEQMSEKVDQATAKVASKEELRAHEAKVEAKVEKYESKILQAISDLRKDMDSKFEAQRKDTEIMKRDIIIRLTGVMITVVVGAAGLILTAIKLLF